MVYRARQVFVTDRIAFIDLNRSLLCGFGIVLLAETFYINSLVGY